MVKINEQLILAELSETQFVTGKQMAQQLNVGVKTIQKYIALLQETLRNHGASIVCKPRMGYLLVVEDTEAFAQYVEQAANTNDVPRQQWVMTQLVQHPFVKQEELAEALFVTRRTISSLVQDIRHLWQPFGVTIKTSPYLGMSVQGTESAIRRVICHWPEVCQHQLTAPMREQVRAFLQTHARLSEVAIESACRLLVATYMRSQNGFMSDTAAHASPLQQGVATLSAQIGWPLPASECAFVAAYIEGLQADPGDCAQSSDAQLLDEALLMVTKVFGGSWQAPSKFLDDLRKHCAALEQRARSKAFVINPLLSQIKRHLNSEYAMATLFCKVLYQQQQLVIPDDEIGFLAIVFATGTMRLTGLVKRVLVVTSGAKSSLRLMEMTYHELLRDCVQTIDVLDVSEVTEEVLRTYDYVVSTETLPQMTDVLVLQSPYFLNEADKQQLKATITELEHNRAAQLLRQMIVVNKVQVATPEALCQLAGDILEAHYEVALTDNLLARLALGHTQIGPRVALLHPLEPVSQQFISLFVCEQPMFWEEGPIDAVLVVSLPTISAQTQQLYAVLSRFMMETDYVAQAIHLTNSDQIKKLMIDLWEKERQKWKNGF